MVALWCRVPNVCSSSIYLRIYRKLGCIFAFLNPMKKIHSVSDLKADSIKLGQDIATLDRSSLCFFGRNHKFIKRRVTPTFANFNSISCMSSWSEWVFDRPRRRISRAIYLGSSKFIRTEEETTPLLHFTTLAQSSLMPGSTKNASTKRNTSTIQ